MRVKKYALGLIGWPLEHSLSPVIHTTALRSRGLEGEYQLFPIPALPEGAGKLGGILDSMRRGELDGLNVTLPHKRTVLDHLDQLTPVAEAIGAVNTIFRDGRELIGDNTDKDGFLYDLAATLSPEVGGALILGAGGAARAVAYALCETRWELWIASRRLHQAVELVEMMRSLGHNYVSAIPLVPGHLETISPRCTLIVNATPVGTWPHMGPSPWPVDVPFPSKAAVYDLVYTPQETTLSRLASQAGIPVATGLGMLIEQAAMAFELWTGQQAPKKAMWRRAVQAAGAQHERLGGG